MLHTEAARSRRGVRSQATLHCFFRMPMKEGGIASTGPRYAHSWVPCLLLVEAGDAMQAVAIAILCNEAAPGINRSGTLV